MKKILSVIFSMSMILSMSLTALAEEPVEVNDTDSGLEVQIVEDFETMVPRNITAGDLTKADDLPINIPETASGLSLETGMQLMDSEGVLEAESMARSASGVIQSWTGTIANQGQFAYYIATLTPKDILSATLVCPQNPDLNYDLLLYEVDSNGNLGNMLNASITETYMNTYPDGTTKTMDESLAYINNTAETRNYAVIILATAGGSATDAFKLTLSLDTAGSYDGYEYNNSPYDAYELQELTKVGLRASSLTLHMANDQDWFLLRTSSSEISEASIIPERTDGKKYKIEVYTADGNKMKLSSSAGGDLYKIQPGVNYIKVFADEPSFESSEYTLKILGLSSTPASVGLRINGDEGREQYASYPQGTYFRFQNKLCPEVIVLSKNGFPVSGVSASLYWQSEGWNEHTGHKTRSITALTNNSGMAVLTLAKDLPSPNDLPIALGEHTYMRNGAITFMDYYDMDYIEIHACGETLYAGPVYHLMRSVYVSS